MCFFYDGNCGGGVSGYCLALAKAATWPCNQKPTCGCDGNLYDEGCAAVAAHVSPSGASTTNCGAKPLPCTDSPSSPSCFPSQYCMVWSSGATASAACSRFDISCAQPSVRLPLVQRADLQLLVLLPSGIVRLTCNN